MKKREIDVFEHAGEIIAALRKGVAITAKAGDRVNAMTISWGTLGIEWAAPIFTTFVRENRFTRGLLDAGDSFTVNIPVEGSDRKLLGLLGTKSGHDMDKVKEFGLTLVESDVVGAPAIKELPLTLECRIVHRQLQDRDALAEDKMKFYPQDVDGSFSGANRDFHVAYTGEIVKAYVIED